MVDVKKGDLVRIEYTGRLASTGRLFDTTSEELARQAGIFGSGTKYGPRLTLFGAGAMVRGVEEAIFACPLGKSEDFLITSDKAFGNKRPELIRMVAAREFSKQGVSPEPDLLVTLDGAGARVKSVASGRVMVDFNHPLAGESVLYSLKVLEIISDARKKIEAVLSSLGLQAEVSQDGSGKCTVTFASGADAQKTEAAKRSILSFMPETEFRVS